MFAYETLLEALNARKAVSFTYHGQHRVVSPYILGKNKLMGLQTEGGSLSGEPRSLKYFEVPEILKEGMYLLRALHKIKLWEDSYHLFG